MNCEDAKTLMTIDVFGELDAADRATLDEHMRLCPSCARNFEKSASLRHSIEVPGSLSLPDWERSWAVISNRALDRPDTFRFSNREFGQSLWGDDARESRVLIAGTLVALGQPQYQQIIMDALKTENKSETSLKIAALQSLVDLDAAIAIPALRQIIQREVDTAIQREVDTAIQRRCLELLARNYATQVSGILEDIVRKGGDEGVRQEAQYWLDKIKIHSIPVQLNYYCFGSRLTDTSEYAKVPEGKVATFPIRHDRFGDASTAKNRISATFNNRIVIKPGGASSWNATGPYELMKIKGKYVNVSHNMDGIIIGFDGGSIKKTTQSIEGQVFMDDVAAPFKVDNGNDILLAARRGDRMALMYLEMVPTDVSAVYRSDNNESSGRRMKSVSRTSLKQPIYREESHIEGGIVIKSTRSSTSVLLRGDIWDYSLAKAEIPGAGGTWTLTGHLLFMQKEQVLVGRMAKLIRPDGATAAIGDEIRVPIKNPSAFQIDKGKKD